MIQPLIWIDGIIGAGKTTAAEELGKRLNLQVFREPVNEELLKIYYQDQKRWGFSFQINMLHKRYDIQLEAANPVINYSGSIIDRALPADRVFAKMLMQDKKIHPIEWEIYEQAYNVLTKSLTPPNLLIFLDISPVTALKRIKQRDREAERGTSLPMHYLKRLDQFYKELLNDIRTNNHVWSLGMEIWEIDWNEDWKSLDPLIEKIKEHYNLLNLSQEHTFVRQRIQNNSLQ
jgi:deoxyadenosine/deoxycytidine kinase